MNLTEHLGSRERVLDPQLQLAQAGSRVAHARDELAEIDRVIADAMAAREAALAELREAEAEHAKRLIVWQWRWKGMAA